MTDLELVEVKDKAILYSLLQLYLEEFSRITEVEKSTSGQFLYPYFDHYWQDPERSPYFIKSHEKICGFAMIRGDKDPTNGQKIMEIAEFFIKEEYRRSHIGKEIVFKIWDAYPLKWRLSVLEKNSAAKTFWSTVINQYTKGQFEESIDHSLNPCFSFYSKRFV